MASNVFLTRQVEGAGAAALRMVGAEPTPELVSMVEQLGVGEMVMRDEYGRLGVIHVAPPVDPRTARAFDTRPRSGEDGFTLDDHAVDGGDDEGVDRPTGDAGPAGDRAGGAGPWWDDDGRRIEDGPVTPPSSPALDAEPVPDLEIEPDWEPVETSSGPAPTLQPLPVAARPRLTSDLFERLVAALDDHHPNGDRREALDVASFVVPRD
jgi:hypothetical protein